MSTKEQILSDKTYKEVGIDWREGYGEQSLGI